MPINLQIIAGSGLLILCAVAHLSVAALIVGYLRKYRPLDAKVTTGGFFGLTSGLFFVFVAAHTVQIYLWAFCFWWLGALEGREAPIYFALVTYTTVGYGDVTLSPDFRIFGAMASVTGILMFGMTTAFLVGFFAKFLDERAV